MASAQLSVSTTSSGTRTKWTTSFWVKRSNIGSENTIFGSYLDNDNKDKIAFDSNSKLQFASFQASGYSNGGNLVTNRVFRDTNAWYHIVCRWDTTNATANDRMKIWVNGVEETSFSSRTNPSSGRESLINYTTYTRIGSNGSPGNYLDGLLSHVHFCDNQLYQASNFGESDSNGVWTPKPSPSVSYGSTGYFLKMDNSGNMGLDSSGQSNNLTTSGTITQAKDTPSNVFATLNPLDKGYTGTMNTSDGNLTMDSATSSGDYGMRSTLAANSGKYYWETKLPNYGGGNGGNTMVVMDASIRLQINMQGGSPRAGSWGIQRYSDSATNLFEDGTFFSQNTAMWGGFTTSDIIGIALDCDNGKIYFSKNGVFKDRNGNTGDPANGTNPTFSGLDTSKFYTFYTENRANLDNGITVNFGNGYFQTTAVASAGTNASGIGIFEHDVPTGYTALSTKGLNL